MLRTYSKVPREQDARGDDANRPDPESMMICMICVPKQLQISIFEARFAIRISWSAGHIKRCQKFEQTLRRPQEEREAPIQCIESDIDPERISQIQGSSAADGATNLALVKARPPQEIADDPVAYKMWCEDQRAALRAETRLVDGVSMQVWRKEARRQQWIRQA